MENKIDRIKNGLTVFLSILLLLSAIFLLRSYFNGHFKSVDTLKAYLNTLGFAGPLVLILIQAMQVVIPILPGWLGCIVGAGMFGAAGGFWCNYIGISLGSIAAYYLARIYGVALVEKMVSIERHQKLVNWVQARNSYTLVFALAILLPLAPDDFLCYFSGLTEMSSKKFIWIIITMKPWCILAYSLLFANLL
ncbi:MAG: VTT domain-containing protein [Eubacteriales bacterium]|nr:VTT domain-containing protein [Eubacteriales bacterium]